MDTSALEGIGLSKIEIKVFITILELGETKAGKIIERSVLQSSSVYNAINTLIAKGLVSFIKKSEVKYYKAADPQTIVDYLELKKREYLKILPELKAKQKKTQTDSVEFYKSFKGIKTMISKMLKDAKKRDLYLTFSIDDPIQFQNARERVFRPLKQLTIEKNLITRGIFHENNRYNPTKSSRMQKRYLSIPLPPNTIIVNNKVAIISWEEDPKGILIHSKEMAEKYTHFFEAIWKIAKK